jgi:biotin transport system substrate-specific component
VFDALSAQPPASLVLADAFARTSARSVALVVGGAALVGVAAQVVVPLPGTPVPFTLQTFAVLLVGAALGRNRAIASMTLYAVAGAAGVAWFAGGSSGIPLASAGYILGFIIAAALVGSCAQRGGDRTVLRTTATMLAGTVVIYAFGVPVLMQATGMGLAAALSAGVVPFVIGDLLKVAAASALLPAAWKAVGPRA